MSAIIELSPWQKLHSHIVSCNACKKVKKKIIKLCPVGALLLARANAEPEESGKLRTFPFVAKLYERVGTPFGEAVVVDRSIQSPHMYEKTDWSTGTSTWRTSSPVIVGYEVETDEAVRHYIRPYQVTSLRKERGHGVQTASKSVGAGSIPAAPANDDLIFGRQ